jgi:transketolase
VLRPADPTESVEAWRWAMAYRGGPVALIFTRQNVPVIDQTLCAPASELRRGAYVLREAKGGKPKVVVIATGSEVSLALEAQAQLSAEGLHVRVVSMPSWELFAQQPIAYCRGVLPAGVPRVAVEAGVGFGWERWVGHGVIVACDRYGASAPGPVAMQKLGFNVENVKLAIWQAATGS